MSILVSVLNFSTLKVNITPLYHTHQNKLLSGESMIDFPTFLELMQDVKRDGDSEAEIEEAFLVFDPHKSGVISASDMRHIMMNLGEKLSEEEATDMVVFADSSGTGEIRYRGEAESTESFI